MVEFYHYMFYKAYLWQVRKMKNIDLPLYSSSILMSFVMSLNCAIVSDVVSYFVYYNGNPSVWTYWIPLTIICVFNYWYFSKDSRWKSVVKWGDKMSCIEKRERNIYYWIYVITTLLLFAIEFYIRYENVFYIYPKHFTLPDNIHFSDHEDLSHIHLLQQQCR